MDEIERKFLLNAVPPLVEGRPWSRIDQGYIAIADDVEVRIRARDDEHLLTAKGGQGLVRREVTVPLSAEQFEELWPLTAGRRVRKRRWVIAHDDVELEIDVFDDDLEGLVVVEVEFASTEVGRGFTPPEWFGPEVTDDPRYRNAALAVDGVPPR